MSEPTTAVLGVGEDDLVTGEAVALDLPPASIGLRVLGAVLDYIIVGVVIYVLVLLVIVASPKLDGALAMGLLTMALVGGTIGYPVAMETVTKGHTVGKWAAGLRTVRDDAGPITFRHALTRGLIGFVEIYTFTGVPALLAAAFHPRSKRIGDLAAGTYVVRERVNVQLPPPVPMPPHLQEWAAAADIARMPDHLAMQVRTFLPAAFTMTPDVRAAMGQELLEEVMLYVSPPPPAGNHPEYILAAVVADRRRRDLEGLHRDALLRERLIPGYRFGRSTDSMPPGSRMPPTPPGSRMPPTPPGSRMPPTPPGSRMPPTPPAFPGQPGWPTPPGSPTTAPNYPVSGYQPIPVDAVRPESSSPPPWGGGDRW